MGNDMNRRSFLKDMLLAGVGFSILPPATTYDRIWRAEKQPILLNQMGLLDWFWYNQDGTRHEVWENKNVVRYVSVLDYKKAVVRYEQDRWLNP